MDGNTIVFSGIALILVGFMLVFSGTVLSSIKGGKSDVKSGGVFLIGPIPIVWGSDKNMAYTAMGFTIFLLVFYFIFLRR